MKTVLLLDAARMDAHFETASSFTLQRFSLYAHPKNDLLHSVAPWIFEYPGPPAFAEFFRTEGWGQSWGVLVGSGADINELHRHFRRFLTVRLEDGEELYFRFYDPRVLRVFLPTCSPAQLQEFFGPVGTFIVEDEDPQFALLYRLQRGVLHTERRSAADVLQEPKTAMAGAQPGSSVAAPTPTAATPAVPELPHAELPKKPAPPKWRMFD
ncbi:DUF4123 domain-containing protein [Flaviaesturariibacter amylovorans]|uniref:DUF4123 domain-containing protein n=1 Tax=Flaviaesturariibacter amylovorans TaxID=1084520 RepID=A0ABP8HRG7_9BACT